MGLSDLIAGGMDATAATELLLNVIWTIVGATLVYFMQAGFAMCEAGFTRAKNTGNILMKNMMDFVLGSLFFFMKETSGLSKQRRMPGDLISEANRRNCSSRHGRLQQVFLRHGVQGSPYGSCHAD